MKVGIGFCDEWDAFVSGRKSAAEAIERGDIERPDCTLAFCHGQMSHEEFLRGILSITGEGVPVLGGSAIGVITNDHLSYEGHPSAVAVFQWESVLCRFEVAKILNGDAKSAGRELVCRLSSRESDRLLLIFYDSIQVPSGGTNGPVLNASSLVVQGIEQEVDPGTPLVGAGLIGDYSFGPVHQFCGGMISNQSIIGLMLGGAITPFCRIMHGCTPLDGRYHTITRMEGSSIFELDGRPVVEMIDEIYGNRVWRLQHPVHLLALGVNHGERWGTPRESEYVNRLIAGILPDGSGVSLFETDFQLGEEIQFMIRDNNTMVESAARNSLELMEDIEKSGKRPHFALYIDCAGRASAHSNAVVEEAWEVQKALNSHGIPLLGFYSGVEIAPLLRKSRGLDWTGVLIVLAGD